MLNLADVCHQRNIHLTTFATGCIFHYDKDFPEGSGKGFKEGDTPNFTGSYYSYTKARPCCGACNRPCAAWRHPQHSWAVVLPGPALRTQFRTRSATSRGC